MTLTISQLIEKLGEFSAVHGDLPVYIGNYSPITKCIAIVKDTKPDSDQEVIVLYEKILLITTE